jgi:predicted transcriptional regulator
MALTLTLGIASLANVEVKFDPQLQEKLKRTAAQQGRASESLVAEAVERMLSYDEWFVAKVEKEWPQLTAAGWSTLQKSAR